MNDTPKYSELENRIEELEEGIEELYVERDQALDELAASEEAGIHGIKKALEYGKVLHEKDLQIAELEKGRNAIEDCNDDTVNLAAELRTQRDEARAEVERLEASTGRRARLFKIADDGMAFHAKDADDLRAELATAVGRIEASNIYGVDMLEAHSEVLRELAVAVGLLRDVVNAMTDAEVVTLQSAMRAFLARHDKGEK